MSFDLEQLKGELCELYPYHRGVFPRDTLYHLWRLLEDDGAADKVFHSQSIDFTLPVSTRGDLAAFCEWFSQPRRFLLIVVAKATGKFAGFIWFDDLIPEKRANANLFFHHDYYGPLAMEAGRLALRYAFEHLGVGKLWAFTPWKEAAGYARRLGFKPLISLVDYVALGDKEADLHILSLEKGDTWTQT